MRAIDRSLVDEVWRDVAIYPAARADAEAREFLEGQPHAAAYLGRALTAQAPEVQRAAFGLAFLLFKVLERSLGRPFPEVSAQRIAAAHEATARWLEAQGVPASQALDAAESGHPTLVRYIVDVFYGSECPRPAGGRTPEPPTAPTEGYDAGVRVRLILVLRTLAAAVDLDEVRSA